MTTTNVEMPGTPPGWVNAAMRVMLRTPGLQRLLGRAFAVITVTGAKTGRRYDIVVQYTTHDGDAVVLSQRIRRWWRDIPARPEVLLRRRGTTMAGRARIAEGAEAQSLLTDCLASEPRVAGFYGIAIRPDGSVEPEAVEALLERVVVILVELRPLSVELTSADLEMSVS